MKRLKRLLSVLFVWLCVAFCCSMYALAAENDVIKNDQNGIPDKVLYRGDSERAWEKEKSDIY